MNFVGPFAILALQTVCKSCQTNSKKRNGDLISQCGMSERLGVVCSTHLKGTSDREKVL